MCAMPDTFRSRYLLGIDYVRRTVDNVAKLYVFVKMQNENERNTFEKMHSMLDSRTCRIRAEFLS